MTIRARLGLAVYLGSAAICGLASVPAAARVAEVKVAAQPLGQALRSVARQTSTNILFAPEAVRGLRAPALKGHFTGPGAVEHLLRKSALGFEINPDDTILIRRVSDAGLARRSPEAAAPLHFAQISSAQAATVQPTPSVPAGAQADDAVNTSADTSTAPNERASNPAAIEEILVTARRVSEDVQKVPLSVSALTGSSLERRGLVNATELSFVVPSLNLIPSNSTRTAILQIRGVGTGGINAGIEPSVGVYLDGAYQKFGAAALSSNFLDIETVEILRGPQGTLYGRNTPVGAVIVRSRVPTETTEAMLRASVGNYESASVSGYISGKIADKLTGRISFMGDRREGYDFNIATGGDINGQKQFGGRARLRWQPSARFTGDVIAFYTQMESNCCAGDNVDPTGPGGIASPGFLAAIATAIGRPYTNLTSKDHILDTNENLFTRDKNFGGSFTGSFDLTDNLTLTSITAYTGTRLAAPGAPGSSQPLVALKQTFHNDIDTYSQELRIASGQNNPVTYQGGVYLFQEDTNFTETRTSFQPNRIFPDGTTVPAGFASYYNFKQRTQSISGYAQATWSIVDALRLSAGGRYSYDHKRASTVSATTPGSPANFRSAFPSADNPNLKKNESKFTWLASLQYDLAADIMIYATYSTGWKSGGFSGRLQAPGTPLEFEAEESRNYELGLKSRFFDRRFLANLSLFKLNELNFQDSIQNPVSGQGFIVGNAGDIRAKGVELDLQARPVRNVSLYGTLTYLESNFANYSAAPCYSGKTPNGSKPGTCNLNGQRPANSPKWRYSVGGEITDPIANDSMNLFLRTDAAYTGKQYLIATLDPRSLEGDYLLVNGRMGIAASDRRWEFAVWGKNLTDERYYTVVAPLPNGGFYSNGGRSGVSTALIGLTSAPRTYGGEVTFKF